MSGGSAARFNIPLPNDYQTASEKVQVYFSTMEGSLTEQNFTVRGTNSSGSWSTVPLPKENFRKRQDWANERSKWTYLLEFKRVDTVRTYTGYHP